MVDTISARYNASEHQHRTLTIEAAANEQKNEAGSNGTDVDETDKPARRKHSRTPLARSSGSAG